MTRRFGLWRFTYLVHAIRARRYYRDVEGYTPAQLSCLSCVWEHDPEDHDTPWQWIYCDKCDWGNH